MSAGPGGLDAHLDFAPRPTGVSHAGAIIALAETATAAAMWESKPTGELRPELFPVTGQMSANLIRDTDGGPLVRQPEVAPGSASPTVPGEPPGR